jgi:hypothetical protein
LLKSESIALLLFDALLLEAGTRASAIGLLREDSRFASLDERGGWSSSFSLESLSGLGDS